MRKRGLSVLVCFVLGGCGALDNTSMPWTNTDAKIYLAPNKWVWTNSWEADRFECETSTPQNNHTHMPICYGDGRWALRCVCRGGR